MQPPPDSPPPPEAAGDRADRYLAEAFAVASRARMKSLIEERRVTRNGTLITQPYERVIDGAEYATPPAIVADDASARPPVAA